MTILSVIWGLFAERLLPIVFRTPFWIAWLRVLLKPMDTLNAVFVAQVQQSYYLLNFNSQTLVLEWHLRNYFNTSDIHIINHNNFADDAILYDDALNIVTPIAYGDEHITLVQTDEMIVYDVSPTFGTNFTVNAPLFLQTQDNELRQMVERYRHAGFTYNVIYS